jgi:hypothetical protein
MRTSEALSVTVHARRLTAAAALTSLCAVFAFVSPALAATYNPLDVIPYDTWRASGSMSTEDIQSFLDSQSGPLKSYKTADYHDPTLIDDSAPTHHSTPKTAARIIWEAARAWNLNPKVILATIQKEQSLLTTSNSANAARLVKAMGCGVYGIDPVTGHTKNRMPGFGHQIWDGARVLSRYEITYNWFPGSTRTVTAYKTVDATKTVDGVVVSYHKRVSYPKTIKPANASTFALYIYTPYYPQKLVWDIYVRYFGDPQTAPRMRPVYSFRHRSTGAYYYTASEGTRYAMLRSHGYVSLGVSFTIDSSSTANSAPLYRLQNTKTLAYYYTTSAAKKDSLLKVRPVTWRLSGTVGQVSKVATAGTTPVYRLENKRTHGILLTRYASTVKRLSTGRKATFYNRGIAFHLGRSADTTIPVGP